MPEQVLLNIYDMYWVNDYVSTVGIGVYHSGVELYGTEYSFGGHPYECTGIFDNTPRDTNELGENFRFRETIVLGTTDFARDEVEQLLNDLGDEFRGDKYHLITKNCNHFSAALAKVGFCEIFCVYPAKPETQLLCGATVPGYINRLASIGNNIPFLERMLPPEWLTPVALQNSLNERRQSNGDRMIRYSETLRHDTGHDHRTSSVSNLFDTSHASSSSKYDKYAMKYNNPAPPTMSATSSPMVSTKQSQNNHNNNISSSSATTNGIASGGKWASFASFFTGDRPSSASIRPITNHSSSVHQNGTAHTQNNSLVEQAEEALSEMERSHTSTCTTGVQKMWDDWKKGE